MVFTRPKTVAIVGGGPSGLFVALALQEQGIKSVIFDSRGPETHEGGSLVLSPNALRLLDPLGLYQRLLPHSYLFERQDIVNEQGDILDRYYYGHERLFGYKCSRIRRSQLGEEATALAVERGIDIRYHSRFTRVIQDSQDTVAFEINGNVEHADLLIGADGIFSSVRKHIRNAELIYGGVLGLLCRIPTSTIKLPRSDTSPVCTIRSEAGAWILFPDGREAQETVAAIQIPYPEQTRATWRAMDSDHEQILQLIQKDYDRWGDSGKSIINAIAEHHNEMFVWPYYSVPQLDTWMSPTKRVLTIGDAAHAVPPSSGQGVSQAVEDACSLAWLLGADVDHCKALDFWEKWRMARIEQVTNVAKAINIKRLPEAQRLQHQDALNEDLENIKGGATQQDWLFKANIKAEIKTWIDSQQ